MATEAEVQALRNQIARLIGDKVQLENRVIELERDRSEMAVEGLAAASVRSVRSAEDAMALEAPGSNFRVPELELTVRGYVSARDGAVLLRLPRSELTVPPEHLGTIRLLAVEVPPASTVEQTRTPARPALASALDDVRAAFGGWMPRTGKTAARDIVERAAELSVEVQDLSSVAAQSALSGLSLAAARFGRSLTLFAGKTSATPLRECGQRLARQVKEPRKDPETLTSVLRDLARSVELVRPKQSRKK